MNLHVESFHENGVILSADIEIRTTGQQNFTGVLLEKFNRKH